MFNIEFIEILIGNVQLYIFDVFILLSLSLIFLRKVMISIINPLTIGILSTVFADTIPLFLFQLNLISWEKFFFVFFCEICFWFFFLYYFNKRNSPSKAILHEKYYLERLFRICFCSIVFYYSFVFVYSGIGLLRGNRFDVYNEQPILMLLAGFSTFPTMFCYLYGYEMLHARKYKKGILVILIMATFSFLSGGKGAIVAVFTSYFIYRHFYLNKRISIPKYVYGLLFLFPLLTLAISRNTDISMAFGSFLFRIVQYGDCYWMGLPDKTLDALAVSSPISYIFNPFLKLFGLGIEHREAFGNMIISEINPDYKNVQGGPNARCPITAYILFQQYGFIFASICGIISSFLAFRIRKYIPRGFFGLTVYGTFYSMSLSIATDPLMVLQNFLKTIFVIILLYIYLVKVLNARVVKIHSSRSAFQNSK